MLTFQSPCSCLKQHFSITPELIQSHRKEKDMPSYDYHDKIRNVVHDHHHHHYYYCNPGFHSHWCQGHRSEGGKERREKAVVPQWYRPEGGGGGREGMVHGNTITTSSSTASSSSGSGSACAYESCNIAASAEAYRCSRAHTYDSRDNDDGGGRGGLPAWFIAKPSASAMDQSHGIRAATDKATLAAADAAHRSLLRDMLLGRYVVSEPLAGRWPFGGEKEGHCGDVDGVRVLFVEGKKRRRTYEVKRRNDEITLVWRKRGGW